MNKKFKWFDFASRDNPQRSGAPDLDSLISETQSGSKPASAAKSAPAAKKVGGSAKKCQKGKSCSATCIAKGDTCLVDFPPTVQEAIKKVVQKIIAKQGITAGSDADIVLGTSLEELYGASANSVSGKAKTGQTLYPPEVAARYAQFQKDGKFAVKKTAIDDEDIEAVWSALPAKTRAELQSKGQPPKFIERDEKRGKIILKTLLETGFRDEITGQTYSWKEVQSDHRKPIAFFSDSDKANVEKNGNLVMVHKGYNQLKGTLEGKGASQKDGEAFVRTRLEEEFTKQSKRTREEFNKLIGEAASKDAGKTELKKQLTDNSPLWSKKDWATQVSALNGPAMQMLASIHGKLNNTSNRFSPSYSQGRNFAPKYASADVLKVALLTQQGVPKDLWPPGLIDKAAKAVKSDLSGLETRAANEGREGSDYKKYYIKKFKEFANDALPPEIASVFSGNE